MYLCETLTTVDVACKYITPFGFAHCAGSDVAGRSGGSILVWYDEINIQVLDISPNWIHVLLHLDSEKNVLLSFIYGHQNPQYRYVLWDFMKSVAAVNEIPWLLIRDINQILYPQDKASCTAHTVGVEAFRDTIYVCGLTDIIPVGS